MSRQKPDYRRRRLIAATALLAVIIAGVWLGVALSGGGQERSVVRPAASAAPRPASAASTSPAPARAPAAGAWDRRAPQEWPRQGAAARQAGVPILMYHLISAAPAGTSYPELWVPPAEFAAHVAALGDAGFTAVTLDEVWEAWHGEGRLPQRPIVLSFDDGSYSQVLEAGPVLLKAGWPGVLNLTVDHVGADGIPSWGVKRLLRQGWTVDSHSLTHPDVTTLDAAGLRRELAGSRREIERRFGVTPRFFCYPAGRNDAPSRAAVKAAGYDGATTTEPGIAARSGDPFGLPRVRVDPGLSGSAVVALARGSAA